MKRKQLLQSALALLGLAVLGSTSASAQTYPNRPVRIVVPFATGGPADVYARFIAQRLSDSLGQSFVVDNKPGGGSVIGTDLAAKAAPDGYTFLFTPSSAIALNPLVVAKMPYDTQRDLLPVAQIGQSGFLMLAHPSTGFKTMQDMVQFAKANPGKLAYGTWGTGSSGHLAMEGLKQQFSVDMPHIPFKGSAALINDMMGNTISVGFADIASPVPHVRAGRLVALGVTGSRRAPALPDLPTVAEQGYKFDADGWYGVFAPAGTPMDIVRRMNAEINKLLATDDMRQKFIAQNMPAPPIKSAEQFAATVRSDIALWQGLAKGINLKAD